MFWGGNERSSLTLKHYHNTCACNKERRWPTRVAGNQKCFISASPASNQAVNILSTGVQEGILSPRRDLAHPVVIPVPFCAHMTSDCRTIYPQTVFILWFLACSPIVQVNEFMARTGHIREPEESREVRQYERKLGCSHGRLALCRHLACLTSHRLLQNISGSLVSQEHYSCCVHDKKSVVLLKARVNQILGRWASSCKSYSHAVLCQTGELPNCGPGYNVKSSAERTVIRLQCFCSRPTFFYEETRK